MNVGMISARTPGHHREAGQQRRERARAGAGTPWRSSRVAPADSGIAMMIVISTASSSVASWRNSSPSTSSTAASTTAL